MTTEANKPKPKPDKDKVDFESLYKTQLAKTSGLEEKLNQLQGQFESLTSDHTTLKDKFNQVKLENNGNDPKTLESIKADIQATLESQWSQKFSSLESNLNEANSKLQNYEIVTPVLEKTAHFQPGSGALVRMLTEKHCKKIDGQTFIVDDVGNKIPGEKPGEYLGLEHFPKWLETTYPFFVGNNTKSGDFESSSKSRSFHTNIDFQKFKSLNPNEQREFLKDVKPEDAKKLLNGMG